MITVGDFSVVTTTPWEHGAWLSPGALPQGAAGVLSLRPSSHRRVSHWEDIFKNVRFTCINVRYRVLFAAPWLCLMSLKTYYMSRMHYIGTPFAFRTPLKEDRRLEDRLFKRCFLLPLRATSPKDDSRRCGDIQFLGAGCRGRIEIFKMFWMKQPGSMGICVKGWCSV